MGVATEVVAYRFDGFILDLQRAALVTEKGESVPVRHQSFRLLCLFVENAGRLVGREAITQALWPRLTVSDDSITQCVGDLRRALRDESQTKIKTVLRRGYIFTPEVTSASSIPSTDQLALVGRPSVAVLPFSNMSADPSQDYLADGVAENVTTELARNRSLLVICREVIEKRLVDFLTGAVESHRILAQVRAGCYVLHQVCM